MRTSRLLAAALALVAAVAIAIPAWIVTHPPAGRPAPRVVHSRAVVPQVVVPPVDPVTYQELAPEDAVAVNDAVPFSDAPNPAARPFRFAGGGDDLARARDCLAAAVWYEAGDDAVGERAVAQVVLNRVRHPAFPGTVCGVVFQGSDRSTGCQFTFTCDGALARVPSGAAWNRARDIAGRALAGYVYALVGLATHYHTNWVVPYWSSSLDKIAEVHTHLFFRWTGWWGTPAAFRGRAAGAEPAMAQLASLSLAHAGAVTSPRLPDGALPTLVEDTLLPNGAPAVPGDPDTFVARLDPGAAPDSYRHLAVARCGARARCKFMGWTDPRLVPAGAGLTPQQMAAMAFSYLRDRDAGFEKSLWNCTLFPGAPPGGCMRRQASMTIAPVTPPPLAAARPVPQLEGVRRRAAPGGTEASGLTPPQTVPVPAPSLRLPRLRSGAAASQPPA